MDFGFMLILILLVFLSYLCFVIWFVRGVRVASRIQPDSNSGEFADFSIIIAAHDEESRIAETLECLINQVYPPEKYEVILVADRCTDQTVPIARNSAARFNGLKIVEITNIPAGIAPKKYAISQGIEQASFNNLILMDADCLTGPLYLEAFSEYFNSGIQVLVNVPKAAASGSLLHNYLLPERLVTWGIAAASIGHGRPFLSFGTTWGYTRKLFNEAGGFSGFAKSLSGDDDLLIYQMGKLNPPAAICLKPEGWGRTRLPESWREFTVQRRRHHSAGRYYAPKIKTGYAVFHLSNFALWLLPVFYLPALIFLFLKFAADFFCLKYVSRIFKEKISVRRFVVFEIGYVLHNLIIAPAGFFGKIRWKYEQQES